MNKLLSPRKILMLLGFIFSVQAFASFVDDGAAKKSNNNISLKNFNRSYYKTTAYPRFHLSQFQYKGSTNLYQVNKTGMVEGQSFIRLQNGNTTYVYPYKYKVKVPRFVTPTPPQR